MGAIGAADDDVANAQGEEEFEVGVRQNAIEYSAADTNNDNKFVPATRAVTARRRERDGRTSYAKPIRRRRTCVPRRASLAG